MLPFRNRVLNEIVSFIHSRYAINQYNENIKKFSSYIDSNGDIFDKEVYSGGGDHLSLTHELYSCEHFINAHSLSTNKPNATSPKASSNSSRPIEIFSVLARFLNASHAAMLDNVERQFLANSLNPLLNTSLTRLDSIRFNSNETELNARLTGCMQRMVLGLFFIFNEQYTRLFESDSKFRALLVDKYELINETLAKFNADNASYFLRMPLRDMNRFYEHYKQMQSRVDYYYRPNRTMCHSQPPLLCKFKLNCSYLNSHF